MAYEPLHHKYRPQTFADLVGQEAIATTLSNALKRNRIAPAYLFTGPRGTGKTSSARILAKSLNCLQSSQPTPQPCGQCEVCRAIARGSALDVIEIDAASNTGVDNIREIIERSQFAPVQCRYKVYVIDECHMLSTAAFNALLKTLEEPPERVIFVLATTDPQRVLPTIISRCQRFDYRRIPLEAMVKHLGAIAIQENISITPEALTLVAQIANGGLRDAESLLDQLSLLEDGVTPERVWELVGAVPEQDLLTLLQAIRSQDSEKILDQSRHLMNRGREPLVILQNLASFYLNLLIAKTAPQREDMVAVTAPTWQALCREAQQWPLGKILAGQQHLKDSEVQIKNTTQPRLWLEVTLLGLLHTPQEEKIALPESSPPSPIAKPQENPPVVAATPSPPPAPEPPVSTDIWERILTAIEPKTTQAILRQHGKLISLEDRVAYISISSESLLKLTQPKLAQVEAAFAKVCDHSVKVHLRLGEVPGLEVAAPPPEPVKISPPPVKKEPLPPPPPEPVTVARIPASDNEVQKAAEIFAQYFDGELVNLDTVPAPETPEPSKRAIIRGRPKLEDINAEDLPF
jgi:DNA polymerase-3 subunit gamma/tau